MAGENSHAALQLAASLAGTEQAVLLVEQFGRARVEAAIAPVEARQAEHGAHLTESTLEALEQRIAPGCPRFPFSLSTGRGCILLPGIDDAALPQRERERLQLLAAAVAAPIDERAAFAYADNLSEGITIYRYPENEPEIEFINRSAARRIDSTPERVMLEPRALFRDQKNRQLALDVLAMLHEGDDSTITREVQTLSDASYWVQLQPFPLPACDGVPRVLLISSDVTVVRAGEERESILTSCIELAADAIAVYRMSRGNAVRPALIYGNRAFRTLLSTIADGENASLRIDHGEDLVEYYMHALEDREFVQREGSIYVADGTKKLPVEMHARRLRGATDEHEYIVLSLHDLSLRIAAERERRVLSNAIAESLDFFAIGDFIPPSRGGSHILYMNPAFAQLVGYAPEDLLGRSSGIIISPNNTQQVLTTLTESIEHRKVVNLELMMRAKDGRDIWCEFVAQPIFDDSEEGGYWLTVGREITLRKQATGQIALLTWVLDEIDARVTIYEPTKEQQFIVSYENAASADLGRYRFLELVRGGGIVGRLVKDRKFAESPLRTMLADADGEHVTEIEIRALFDGAGRLAAVITIERDMASTTSPDGRPSVVQLALVTAGIQNMIHAPTPEARMRALTLTLHEGFDASLSVLPNGERQRSGLTFEPNHRRATLHYSSDGPKSALVTWSAALGDAELTTLRLALETFLGAVHLSN